MEIKSSYKLLCIKNPPLSLFNVIVANLRNAKNIKIKAKAFNVIIAYKNMKIYPISISKYKYMPWYVS